MLPVQRKTRSQSKQGRSHQALKPTQSLRCTNCGGAKRPHAACPECGYVRPGLTLNLDKDE